MMVSFVESQFYSGNKLSNYLLKVHRSKWTGFNRIQEVSHIQSGGFHPWLITKETKSFGFDDHNYALLLSYNLKHQYFDHFWIITLWFYFKEFSHLHRIICEHFNQTACIFIYFAHMRNIPCGCVNSYPKKISMLVNHRTSNWMHRFWILLKSCYHQFERQTLLS